MSLLVIFCCIGAAISPFLALVVVLGFTDKTQNLPYLFGGSYAKKKASRSFLRESRKP